MLKELKFQVEKTFGQKIDSRGKAELLAEEIYLNTSLLVSYNTLRRFFGLVENIKASRSTLDTLAIYCGFSSYQDFCKRFPSIDNWPIWEGLFLSLASLSYDQLLLQLKRRKLENQDFGVAFAIAIKELIGMQRHSEVLRLFQDPDFHFSNLHFDQVSQIGVIINMYFRNHHHPKLEKQLLQEENFLHLVVKSNIDYTQFNAKYGQWIQFLERQPHLDAETLLFIGCIRPFMYIANRQSVPKAIINRVPDLAPEQHPILFGRIFCLKMIFSKQAVQRTYYIDLLEKRLQEEPNARAELLYVPAIHSLLTQEKHLTAFTEKALDNLPPIFHWYQISLLGIEEIFLASRCIARKDFKTARHLLANNPIEKIRFGYKSIMDIMCTFFQIQIGHHFNEDTALLATQFAEKCSQINMPLLNQTYFDTYFAADSYSDENC
jgi:hypothetical protein